MRQRNTYKGTNNKAAAAAGRRSRTAQKTFHVLALALLFVMVFSLALFAVMGGADGIFNVAEAASTWTSTKTSDTLTFKGESKNVDTYLNVITKNDSDAHDDQKIGYISDTKTRTGNSYTYSHGPSYGTYMYSDAGNIEFVVRITIKIGGTTTTDYSVKGLANVSLFIAGDGDAATTVKAVATLVTSNSTTAPTANFAYPAQQTTNTQTTIVTKESASRGACIGVKGSYDQVFGELSNGNGQISTAPITVKGGSTVYLWVKMFSSDDSVIATTTRAMYLDSVGFSATAITANGTNYVTKIGSGTSNSTAGYSFDGTCKEDKLSAGSKVSGGNIYVWPMSFTANAARANGRYITTGNGIFTTNHFPSEKGSITYIDKNVQNFYSFGFDALTDCDGVSSKTISMSVPFTISTSRPSIVKLKVNMVHGIMSTGGAKPSGSYYFQIRTEAGTGGTALYTSSTDSFSSAEYTTATVHTKDIDTTLNLSSVTSTTTTLYVRLVATIEKSDAAWSWDDVSDHFFLVGDLGMYDPWDGAGTEGNPFKLQTRADFDTLSSAVSGGNSYSGTYFKVEPLNSASYIDFTTSTVFTPIGTSSYPFKGHLDGNSKSLRNVTVTDSAYAGLFGYVNGANISNVTIGGSTTYNGTFTSNSSSGNAGAIVARISGGTTYIDNCKVYANINNLKGGSGAAAIVGYVVAGSTIYISNCSYVGGTINCSENGTGAIIGYMARGANKLRISSCYANSLVTINGDTNTGGLCGRLETTNAETDSIVIENSYCTSTVGICDGTTAPSTFGGLVGYLTYTGASSSLQIATINQCYYGTGTVGNSSTGGSGGIIGNIRSRINDDKNQENGDVNNCVVSSCFVTSTASINGKSNVGHIVGVKDNKHTVIDSWALLTEAPSSSDNVGSDASLTGRYIVYTTDYTPSPMFGYVSGSFSGITSKNVAGIQVGVAANSMSAGKYLKVTHTSATGNYFKPNYPINDNGNTASSGYTSATTMSSYAYAYFSISYEETPYNLFVSTEDITFTDMNSEIYNAVGKEITESKVSKPSLNSSTKNGNSNNRIYTHECTFTSGPREEDGTAKKAGDYKATVTIKLGGAVVGRIEEVDFIINRKAITVTATSTKYTKDEGNASDGTTMAFGTTEKNPTVYQYMYNMTDNEGIHQGLSKLVLSGIYSADKEGFASVSVIDVTASDAQIEATSSDGAMHKYIFTFSGAIDASDTSREVSVTILDNNYCISYKPDANADAEMVSAVRFAWKISPRKLKVSNVEWTTAPADNAFIYNGAHQGLKSLTIEGLTDGMTDANTAVNVTTSWNNLPQLVDKNKFDFNGTDHAGNTINTGSYTTEIKVNNGNFVLSDTTTKFNWAITPKPIDIGNDIVFGYAFDEAEKFMNPGEMRDISGKVVSSGGTYYTLNSSSTLSVPAPSSTPSVPAPYSIIYIGKSNNYTNINTYNLLWWTADGKKLARGSDYTVQYASNTDSPAVGGWDSLSNLDGNIPEGSDLEYTVYTYYFKFSGTGNYSGDIYVMFSVMFHDFGEEGSGVWGSESNPYIISSDAHLLRLSAIVNGESEPWDSVNGKNGITGVQASDITYAGAYFKVTSDVTADSTYGFKPIGKSDSNYFGGTFDGGYDSASANIIEIGQLLGDTNTSLTGNYLGLFGYIKSATVKNVRLRDQSGDGVNGANSNYVGGIAGYAENSHLENIFVGGAITGYDYVGGLVGKMVGGSIDLVKDGLQKGGNAVTGEDYVGGLFGWIEGVTITGSAKGNAVQVGVVGNNSYVGGIAGMWIINASDTLTAQSQWTDYFKVGNNSSLTISGWSYVGGIAGMLQVTSGCSTENKANGKLEINKDGNLYVNIGGSSQVTISGISSLIGGLFGAVEGLGYKATANLGEADDTVIYLSSRDDIQVTVKNNVSGDAALVAVGGMFGYVGKAGIVIRDNYEISKHVTFDTTFTSQNSMMVGGVAGILGQNAAIEFITQKDSGGNTAAATEIWLLSGGKIFTSSKINYVGMVAGYVAYTAGIYSGEATTLFGNDIRVKVNNELTGGDYVGGAFGAIGKIDLGINFPGGVGYNEIKNLVNYGVFSDAESGLVAVINTVVYSPTRADGAQDPGTGMGGVTVLAAVRGKDYVGGVVGFVGEGARLEFVNSAIINGAVGANFEDYMPIYVGNASSGSATAFNIKGTNYVGGIAGYLSAGIEHSIQNVIVLVTIGTLGEKVASYAGGIVGYIGGGTISNCVAGASTKERQMSTSTSFVNGTENAGGIAGVAEDAHIDNCYTAGFGFTGISSNSGGIVGSTLGAAAVNRSWAFYIKASATYSDIAQNNNGKYILIDSALLGTGSSMLPNVYEFAAMAGIFGTEVTYSKNGTNKTSNVDNTAKAGFVSFAAQVPQPPEDKEQDSKQIALYDASGIGITSGNVKLFDVFANDTTTPSDSTANPNGVYFRLSATAGESMLIVSVKITYKDMKPSKPTADDIKASYRPPAADHNFYSMKDVEYAIDGNSVTNVTGHVYGNGSVLLGTLDHTYTAGSADAPYTISNLTEWQDFAKAVRGGTDYYKKTVKLLADIGTVDLKTEYAGGDKHFKGTFDGNGYTIDVQYTGNGNGISLFPYAENATFKNLTISGTIDATDKLQQPDGHGDVDEGNISYDFLSQDNDWDYGCGVAAFVGSPDNNLTFENCTNAATIKGTKDVGGFVGRINKGSKYEFICCVNQGEIYSGTGYTKDQYNSYPYGTGGIIGRATINMTMESCRNAANVSGGHNVGGIIGLCLGDLTIYNSANTGTIFAHAGKGSGTDLFENAKNGNDVNGIFGYAGGIVGRAGGRVSSKDKSGVGSLSAYACYNTGKINCVGNVAGGIAGGVCEIVPRSKYGVGTDKDGVYVGSKGSNIAYCYNTGDITIGAKNALHANNWTAGGRCEFGGTIAGGIVGVWSKGFIKYCYNVGKIVGHGVIGGNFTWQSRLGGIAGQTEPESANQVRIDYCYNIGEVKLECNGFTIGGDVRYGAGISGYTDREGDISSSVANTIKDDCYSLSNCTVVYNEGSCVYRGNRNEWDYDSKYTNNFSSGIEVTTLADITAYMANETSSVQYVKAKKMIGGGTGGSVASLIGTGENANYLATFNDSNNQVNYDQDFLDGTLNGYIYIYGCLPTLAMFAVDTKEGLSMLSVSYGKDDNGDWVGAQAGSMQSPYIIKDGIDLLGMSALINASSESNTYYTFHDKYIEIAETGNNIDKYNVTSIDMTKLYANNSSTKYGKNWFLYAKGSANNATNFPTSTSSTTGEGTKSAWTEYNYYYDGSGFVKGANFDKMNYIPAGYMGNSGDSQYQYRFEGSFNGRNASINNLKISIYHNDRAYAGLFGKTQDATISNLTLKGAQIAAYKTGSDSTSAYGSVAGGIVAWAGGGTTIDNCKVTNSGTTNSTIAAYAKYNNTSTYTTFASSYAGGIAGVVVSGKSSGESIKYTSGETTTISNCSVSGSTISGYGTNIGGIVGLATGDAVAHANASKTTGDDKGYTNILLQGNNVEGGKTTSKTTIGNTPNTLNTNKYKGIGGIVGVSGGGAQVSILGCKVGVGTGTGTVTVKGISEIGGIVGKSDSTTTISGIQSVDVDGQIIYDPTEVGAKATITDKDLSTTYNRTMIGGVVGTAQNTIFGHVAFAGTVDITNETYSVTKIGGIVGNLGTNTRFDNAVVTVNAKTASGSTPKIYIASANEGNKDIGGMAGYVDGGATNILISGTFNIAPEIRKSSANATSAISATNVGGFIGSTHGTVYIRSIGTTISIGGTIRGLQNVGGLIGLNAAGTSLFIGEDNVSGSTDNGDLIIAIGTASDSTVVYAEGLPDTKKDSAANVGGLIGLNEHDSSSYGTVNMRKGTVFNMAKVYAKDGLSNVGGIIGNNAGNMSTGGSILMGGDGAARTLNLLNFGEIGSANNDNVGGIIGLLSYGSIGGSFVNAGNVTGANFVGGAIGRVENAASLVIATNINGEAIGDTDITNAGVVKGLLYVGGSVGAMFGTITGTEQMQVTFRNTEFEILTTDSIGRALGLTQNTTYSGSVSSNATNVKNTSESSYIGGNVGVLAGKIEYGEFINQSSFEMEATETTNYGFGGSIGIIGEPRNWTSGEYPHQSLVLTNCQFEFYGKNDAKLTFTVAGAAIGVGGVIGVISEGVSFDSSNNFFVSGNVEASGSEYVGGLIGLVRSGSEQTAGVYLSDILLDHTTVEGKEYVGGIVGGMGWENDESDGKGNTIANAFNLHGEVNSTGAASNRGGIVGYVRDNDLNADTAYWIPKTIHDEELSSKNIKTIVETYQWISGQADEVYNTGSSHTGWYFLVAEDGALFDKDATESGVNNNKPVDDDTGIGAGTGVNIFMANDKDLHGNAQMEYWKRIANSYTIEQKTKGDDKKSLTSYIVADGSVGGGEVQKGTLYAAASAGELGKYLTIATAKGTLIDGSNETKVFRGTETNGKGDGISVVHDSDGKNYKNPSDPCLNNGGAGYTYMSFAVSNDSAEKPENSIGNIAIYYSPLVDETTTVVVMKDKTYKDKTYDGQNAVPVIDTTKYPVFKDIPSVADISATGTAGSYAYGVVYTEFNDSPISGTDYTKAGRYEGAVLVLRYDINGDPKPVGSINFAYQITPAEVLITYPSDGNPFGYYGDETYSSEQFFFSFSVGSQTWDDATSEDYVSEQVDALGMYLFFDSDTNGIFAHLTTKMDEATASDNLSVTNAAGNSPANSVNIQVLWDKSKFGVSGLRNRGTYGFITTTTHEYQKYTYNIATNTWDVDDQNGTYACTTDGNYYLAGNSDAFSDKYHGEKLNEAADGGLYARLSKPQKDETPIDLEHVHMFGFFKMQPNEFTFAWAQPGSDTYNGKQHTYRAATITSAAPFTNTSSFIEELKYEGLKFTTTGVTDPWSITDGMLTNVSNVTIDGKSHTQAYLMVSVGPNQGTYTTRFDESTDIRTANCTIADESKTGSSTYKINRKALTVTYVEKRDGSESDVTTTQNTTTLKDYTYNADQQGLIKIIISGIVGKDTVSGNLGSSGSSSGIRVYIGIASGVNGSDYTTRNTTPTDGAVEYTLATGRSINAGSYRIVMNVSSSSNYTLKENSTSTTGDTINWTINKYDITASLDSASEDMIYDGKAHAVDIDLTHGGTSINGNATLSSDGKTYNVKPFGSKDSGVNIGLTYMIVGGTGVDMAVNAGTYTVSLSTASSNNNYSLSAPSGTPAKFTIAPRPVTLNWDSADSYTYNGAYQGKKLATPTFGGDGSALFTGFSIEHNFGEGGSTATITFTNGNGNTETFTISLTGAQINVGTGYSMTVGDIGVSGTNAAGNTDSGNYNIASLEAATFDITKAILSFTIDGGEKSKVYDATTDVNDPGTVKFTGLQGVDADNFTQYALTASYSDKNVGSRTITYTVELTGDAAGNYTLNPTTQTVDATITQRELTVALYLKSGKATKIYDGTVNYGGAGFSGHADGRSQTYRAGNGFEVRGIPTAETATVTITAKFREAGSNLAAYDAFVNGVSGSKDGKQLVFTLNDSNYKLTFSSFDATTESGAYVLTSENITITQKAVRATYANTMQSYANADNTYNTNWQNVEGSSNDIVDGDRSKVAIAVANGWQMDGSSKKVYKTYTQIRGRAGDAQLGATLAKKDGLSGADADAFKNYNLTNQPTLIIGYFVNKGDAFEIGSLASLLIASYYYSASKSGDNKLIPTLPNVKATVVATKANFEAGTNIPTVEGREEQFATWEEYFDYLAEQGHIVIQATAADASLYAGVNEGDWVYYDEVDGTPESYTKFKQIKDISSKFTAEDIEILNGMFGRTIGGTAYDWGSSVANGVKALLENVIKGKVGDVLTVIGSLFGDFTGEYDGDGYVIDGINIMAFSGDDAGFFVSISEGATVGNIHLRNINVVANNVKRVGGLAGSITNVSVSNVSVHGVFNVSAGSNISDTAVGGIAGALGYKGTGGQVLSNAIVLGTINANGITYVGGAVGSNRKESGFNGGTVENIVSMMYIYATGAKEGVGGVIGGGTKAGAGCVYMANSVWNDGSTAGSDGAEAKTYTELYNGSTSGYKDNKYYLSSTTKGTYDALADYTLDDKSFGEDGASVPNAHQSMRLTDIIDIYLLGYTIADTGTYADKNAKVYVRSESSWLVGTAHGTDGSPVEIANQQGVALLRELRFATFKLTADIYMSPSYKMTTYSGAFFGKVNANGHSIYLYDVGNTTMFEHTTDANLAALFTART